MKKLSFRTISHICIAGLCLCLITLAMQAVAIYLDEQIIGVETIEAVSHGSATFYHGRVNQYTAPTVKTKGQEVLEVAKELYGHQKPEMILCPESKYKVEIQGKAHRKVTAIIGKV